MKSVQKKKNQERSKLSLVLIFDFESGYSIMNVKIN